MDGQELYKKGKKLIPGGTQLLSKRPEMFLPDLWPAYYAKAKGVKVTDLAGITYTDMSIMGVGACILGYADPDVDRAVIAALRNGVQCTLNAPEEVELAELLCSLHPWANMVRYARSGGEAMAVAVRIARAHTGKDIIAFCGYHGWYDWYLAANISEDHALDGHLMPGLEPSGVPRGLLGSALPFHYNHIEQLEEIVARNNGRIAAIVMEPRRDQTPEPGFLEKVKKIAREQDAVLVFDEITTGFRMCPGGIHQTLGVNPDIAVFAKAMSNGYAMAAVVGTAEVMESAQSTFISSTNWTERIGPAAALATIRKYQEKHVDDHIISIGNSVMVGWQNAADEAGLPVHISGLSTLNHFSIEGDEKLEMATLFTQIMLEKRYLAYTQFKPSFAHTKKHIDAYISVTKDAFSRIADAHKKGSVRSLLKGSPQRSGFYRLT
ncbi:MAG: aminotransferase class III-fold pyridoxal phosphate-dependent enzyme [Methanoregula sp.]|nr:aminotransferase class III-fold pyridoxal phosphate-dependent enzyme [Methanoregula sp.]